MSNDVAISRPLPTELHFRSPQTQRSHREGNARKMENRTRLRVQKKKPLKRIGIGKKQLLKNLVDYLNSDPFMYAPLLSPPLPSSDILPSTSKVVQLKKPKKEMRRFVEQVGEYLKSDVYMYSPLVDPPCSPREPLQHYGMVRTDVSTRRLTMKVIQPTDHSGNMNQRSESHLPQTDFSNQHGRGLKETVKHTIYQSCRSSSTSTQVLDNLFNAFLLASPRRKSDPQHTAESS